MPEDDPSPRQRGDLDASWWSRHRGNIERYQRVTKPRCLGNRFPFRLASGSRDPLLWQIAWPDLACRSTPHMDIRQWFLYVFSIDWFRSIEAWRQAAFTWHMSCVAFRR